MVEVEKDLAIVVGLVKECVRFFFLGRVLDVVVLRRCGSLISVICGFSVLVFFFGVGVEVFIFVVYFLGRRSEG